MQVKDVSDAQVLTLFPACAYEYRRAIDLLTAQGVPEKVALRKVERLVDRGWLEYGSTIACVWLTPCGLVARQEC